jgi:2-iminobutanoate/2-iminopropanoate deaminase
MPKRDVIQTSSAPAAIGPYSQAIATGQGLIFCSGQIPLDPATGNLVEGDTAAQARQVMKNLEAVLIAAGSGLGQIVKTTIFLVDLADFGKVNEVYGSFFASEPPARSTIQVAALPKAARIEIEAIALQG